MGFTTVPGIRGESEALARNSEGTGNVGNMTFIRTYIHGYSVKIREII